jgi:hypothetical protein
MRNPRSRQTRTRAEPEEAQALGKDMDSTALPTSFCIIEDRNTVQNFAKLQLDEIKSGIQVGFARSCHGAHWPGTTLGAQNRSEPVVE